MTETREETVLTAPSPDLYEAWLDCVRDFTDDLPHGSGDWQVPGFGPDRASFDALLAVVRAAADPTATLPEGQVHSDHWWVTSGDEVVGFLNVRRSLGTDYLRTHGGHVGYSIRASRRRRGHAGRALGLALDRARELGLSRLLVTCEDGNEASTRTIESRGGRLESVHEGMRRYWIEL